MMLLKDHKTIFYKPSQLLQCVLFINPQVSYPVVLQMNEFPIFPCRFPHLNDAILTTQQICIGFRAAQKSGQVEVHRGLLGLAPCRILPGDLLEPTGDLLEPTAPIEIWCKFILKTKKMPKMPRIQLLEYKELYRFTVIHRYQLEVFLYSLHEVPE